MTLVHASKQRSRPASSYAATFACLSFASRSVFYITKRSNQIFKVPGMAHQSFPKLVDLYGWTAQMKLLANVGITGFKARPIRPAAHRPFSSMCVRVLIDCDQVCRLYPLICPTV